MAVLIPDLCRDLEAETAVLVAQLERLDDAGWSTATPADGWTVLDQVAHLAFFDRAVTIAIEDPERFRADVAAASERSGEATVTAVTRVGEGSGVEALERFHAARAAMIKTFEHADLSARVPWYGPAMSVASALTARIMETWAHGQDVFDALGTAHPPTAAVRHVAHIGVRALPNSFVTRGLPVPSSEVRLELTGPEGDEWIWGPEPDRTDDLIIGPAVDFCLVVTQRRHPSDTEIVATGDVATEWMRIAQAFAGPPGSGRKAGQFPRR